MDLLLQQTVTERLSNEGLSAADQPALHSIGCFKNWRIKEEVTFYRSATK